MSTLLCFNFIEKRWIYLQTTGPLPSARENNSSVVVNGSLMVFGGFDGQNWLNDMHQIDLKTLIWSKIDLEYRPPPRFGFVFHKYRHYIYLFGGYGNSEWQ